jgi:hypothetical protein
MTESVVDLLQPVEIENKERERRSVAAGAIERLLSESREASAVVELGEVVHERQFLELSGLLRQLLGLLRQALLIMLLTGDVP